MNKKVILGVILGVLAIAALSTTIITAASTPTACPNGYSCVAPIITRPSGYGYNADVNFCVKRVYASP